jgi:hypothetical protein
MKLLENIENLNVSYCINITNDGIQYLKNIKILNIEMSNIGIEYVEQNYSYIKLNRSIPLYKLN